MTMKCSVYKNCSDVTGLGKFEITSILDDIKNGKYKDKILELRSIKGEKEQSEFKKSKLAAATFAAQFSYRAANKMTTSTGFTCIDFDNVEDILSLMDLLKHNEFIYAAWISPRGNGIKALVKIPNVTTPEEYKTYYYGILYYFLQMKLSIKVDTSTLDISRLCLMSWDPDLYINQASTEWTTKRDNYKDEEVYLLDIPDLGDSDNATALESLDKWINEKESFVEGNRNNFLFKYYAATNRCGIPKTTAKAHAMFQYPFADKEHTTACNSAYRNFSDFAKNRLIDKVVFNEACFNISKRKSKETVIKSLKDMNMTDEEAEIVYTKAKEGLQKRKQWDQFWDVTVTKTGIKIENNAQNLTKWLTKNGWYKYKVTPEADYILVRVVNNIVEEVKDIKEVATFVFRYISSLPPVIGVVSEESIYNYYFKNGVTIFGTMLESALENLPGTFISDSVDEIHIHFKNVIVKCTKNGYETISYTKLNGLIWKSQIIDREFIVDKNINYKDFMYYKFMNNIMSGNVHNVDALRTAMAYYIHSYKDPLNPRAVILNDAKIATNKGDANGGTGKTLIAVTIGEYTNLATYPCDSPAILTKGFAFQRITVKTKVLFLDELQEGFEFKILYSKISGSLTIEKKNQDEYQIPYSDSPKVLIATNYTIPIDGDSNKRRRIDFELSDYYGAHRSPGSEFGKRFFSEYTDREWQIMDNFICESCVLYLKEGLIEPQSVNMLKKNFLSKVYEEFPDWAEMNLIPNEEYLNDYLYNMFKTDYHLASLSVRSFNSYVKEFAKFKGYEYIYKRKSSKDQRWRVTLSNGVNNQVDAVEYELPI